MDLCEGVPLRFRPMHTLAWISYFLSAYNNVIIYIFSLFTRTSLRNTNFSPSHLYIRSLQAPTFILTIFQFRFNSTSFSVSKTFTADFVRTGDIMRYIAFLIVAFT